MHRLFSIAPLAVLACSVPAFAQDATPLVTLPQAQVLRNLLTPGARLPDTLKLSQSWAPAPTMIFKFAKNARLPIATTCYAMRSYDFAAQPGEQPVLTGTTTCTPAKSAQLKSIGNAPAVLLPIDSYTRRETGTYSSPDPAAR